MYHRKAGAILYLLLSEMFSKYVEVIACIKTKNNVSLIYVLYLYQQYNQGGFCEVKIHKV